MSTPPRVRWYVLGVAAAVLTLLPGCTLLKPAGGAVVGSLPGALSGNPLLAVAGAGVGAGGGAWWNEKDQAEKDRDASRAEVERLRQQMIDLQADVRANLRIQEFNAKTSETGAKKVPYIEPKPLPFPVPGEKVDWLNETPWETVRRVILGW